MVSTAAIFLASFIACALATPIIDASPSSLKARQLPPADRYYQITNKCPTAINLYAAGAFDSVIQAGATTMKYATGFTPGPFYTDANGGQAGGARSTKAAFWDRSFYYIVKDPEHLNVAISVAPDRFGRQGLCVPIACKTSVCDQGFPLPGPATLPSPETVHPEPPMYACGTQEGVSLQWNITFCPDGTFPPQTQGADIHPGYNPGKCLDVQGAVFANGTPVQVYDCNGTAAQRWVFVRGSTKVRVANTNFCLDAGSNPANGIDLKIWTCIDGIRAQQWNYERFTDRLRLDQQVNGLSYCADLRNGNLNNGNRFQTWECGNQNVNQVFTIPFA